jgi:hypothetical protein
MSALCTLMVPNVESRDPIARSMDGDEYCVQDNVDMEMECISRYNSDQLMWLTLK